MIHDVSVAYTVANFLLALILLLKAPRNIISRFFFFCVCLLDGMGLLAYALRFIPHEPIGNILRIILVFCFCLLPFFFIHFITIFVRRADLVRSKKNLFFIYFTGIFAYSMTLLGFLPEPISITSELTNSEYLSYVTWHSILFCVGIAILYEHTHGFYGKVERANIIFSAFAILLLILPGPFAETILINIFHLNFDYYFLVCTIGIIFGVFFIFRYKIIVNTIYDALKSALAVMNDIFIITDESFKIQMARGALTPLLQYIEKDLVGRNFTFLIDQKSLLESYREFVVQGKMKESYFDADMILKNGTRLPMNISFTPVYTNEEVTGFVSIARSLSELRHSEQALRLFHHAVESTPQCTAITELQDHIIYANKAFLDKYGYSNEDIIGKPLDVVLSQNNPAILLHDLQQKTVKDKWSGELLHITRQGHEFPAHVINSPIYNEEGNIIGQVSASEDITAQKHAALALQASEGRFRALFENVPVGVFQISTGGKFIAANPTLARMLGHHSVTEQFLQNIKEALYTDQKTTQAWEDLLKQGNAIRNMEIKIKLDEKDTYFLQNINPFRNSFGEIEYFEGTLTDITERKQLEDELLHAQRLESIGTLAGGIAHDFNNILQIIMIHISKLRRSKDTPPAHTESIESIQKSVQRGAGLVRQLMTFARKADIELTSMNVNNAIEELRKLLSQTFSANIEIAAELRANPAGILGNQTQFHQVLLNLCVNARDAMPNGGRLRISSDVVNGISMKSHFPEVADQDYVLITITDTGTGMDDAVRRRIFEPFFTTKGVGQGTGLGLAVVYGIVKNHNGFITVDSIVGQGTSFRIIFPLLEQHKNKSTALTDEDGKIRGGNETILLVEDEDEVRVNLKSALEDKGYHVLVAADGEEATSVYRTQFRSIKLVLLDMGLPKISGWQAFGEMKKLNPDVFAILCSGYIDRDSKNEKLAGGIKDFLEKPYNTDDLLHKVREILDRQNNVPVIQ